MRLVFPILLMGHWSIAGIASTTDSIRPLLSAREDWRWITHSSTSGLPSGRVIAMETDGDGVVWVGTSGGVRWFDGYQFLAPLTGPQTGPKPDPATGDPPDILGDIRRIVCLGNGDIAVQAGSSLWIGRSGKLRRIPTSAKVGQNRPTRA